jgi:serine/threonine protein kinase
MNWLHEGQAMPIVHGDLKASNLLLEDDGQVVIADFGLACMLKHGRRNTAAFEGALSIPISPPEVLNNPLAPRTKAADVYAFGILLLELMQHKPAYPPGSDRHMTMSLVIAGRRPEIPASVPADVADIIRSCWAQDPNTRPPFSSIIQLLSACLPTAPAPDTFLSLIQASPPSRSIYPSIPTADHTSPAANRTKPSQKILKFFTKKDPQRSQSKKNS